MLTIVLPPINDCFDELTNEFVSYGEETLELEHSLVAISKWESKWHKAFITKEPKTLEETIDYIRCMTLNKVDPEVYRRLTNDDVKKVNDYMEDSMTATYINEPPSRPGRNNVMTSEVIYYQMTALNIPFECQYWHLNRLMTLIRVCAIKSDPHPKKMSTRSVMSQNAALNAKRRAAMHSKG